jgi:hypothetical protein
MTTFIGMKTALLYSLLTSAQLHKNRLIPIYINYQFNRQERQVNDMCDFFINKYLIDF